MRQNLTSSLWIWATWTWMTEQTFPESPRHFLFKVSMSLSHYHSHIQPLDKQPCLFWEHTHRHTHKKTGHERAMSPPQVCRSAHWGHYKTWQSSCWVCCGRFWMCRASEISSSTGNTGNMARSVCTSSRDGHWTGNKQQGREQGNPVLQQAIQNSAFNRQQSM